MATLKEVQKDIESLRVDLDKLYEAVGLLSTLVGTLNTEIAVVRACMKIGTAEGEKEKEWVPVYTVDPEAPKKVRYSLV